MSRLWISGPVLWTLLWASAACNGTLSGGSASGPDSRPTSHDSTSAAADTGQTGDIGTADGPTAPPADTAPAPDTTAPAPPVEFSFVAFGDNQFATNSCTSGVPERLAVPAVIEELKPTFVLHTGDLMDHAYESGAYAKFVSCYSSMLAKFPFFPTMGNHDAASGGVLDYKSYLETQLTTRNAAAWGAGYDKDFVVSYNDDPTVYSTSFSSPTHTDSVPSGVSFKTFYAFRHRNAYVISFEQGTRWWANTPKTWVEKHLKAARADATIEHIFVIMHHPMYSSTMAELTSGECIQPVRKQYEPLFRQYDVTAVFSGHAHLYDRFYVPDDGTPTRKDPPPASYPHDGKAVHYIVTGGGGGGLNGCSAPKQETSYDFFQGRKCVHHVTQVLVKGKSLTVNIVEISGSATSHTKTTIDSFTVN